MSKTVVKIGSFEVDDAHLHAGADRAGTLSIPCKSDPTCVCSSTAGMNTPAFRRS